MKFLGKKLILKYIAISRWKTNCYTFLVINISKMQYDEKIMEIYIFGLLKKLNCTEKHTIRKFIDLLENSDNVSESSTIFLTPLTSPELKPLTSPELKPLTSPELKPLTSPELSPLQPLQSLINDDYNLNTIFQTENCNDENAINQTNH